MTHDELLAKINEVGYSVENGHTITIDRIIKQLTALRAVVELHTPTPEGRYPDILCQGCSMTEARLYVDYPCRTIQAIEKELM